MMFSLNLTTNNEIMAASSILMNPTEDVHKANINSFNNNSIAQCFTHQPDKCNYLFSPSFHTHKDITY